MTDLARFHRAYPDEQSEAVWVIGHLGAVSLMIHHFGDIGLPSGRTAGGSVDRHSPRRINESDYEHDQGCHFLEGIPCYCDGSALAADPLIKLWLAGETDRVYEELTAYYVNWLAS